MNLANCDYMGCNKKNVVNFNLLTANIYHAVDISDLMHHSGDRSWVRWRGHFKLRSLVVYWWSNILNLFRFERTPTRRIFIRRGGNIPSWKFRTESQDVSCWQLVYLMHILACIIMINYSLIMTSLLQHSLAKSDTWKGEKRLGLIGMDFVWQTWTV